MSGLRRLALFLIAGNLLCTAQENLRQRGGSWDKIRYLGGAEELDRIRLKYKQREGTLTASETAIEFRLKEGAAVTVALNDVATVSYGSRKWRREGLLWVAIASPAVGGVLYESMKGRAHFISIEYRNKSGKLSGILLQAHKTNFQQAVDALNDLVGLNQRAK